MARHGHAGPDRPYAPPRNISKPQARTEAKVKEDSDLCGRPNEPRVDVVEVQNLARAMSAMLAEWLEAPYFNTFHRP